MQDPRNSNRPVILWLDASRPGPGLTVEVSGPREGREAVKPLAAWLRRARKWRGGGQVQLGVAQPAVVFRAFAIPGAVTSYRQLEEEAGFHWFLPWEWRHGILQLQEWVATTDTALDRHLRGRARVAQRHLFASNPPEACGAGGR
ncbi:MAG: hypothetical protein ACHQ7N_03650 [Candidatus Methylomirabilales bacterium]